MTIKLFQGDKIDTEIANYYSKYLFTTKQTNTSVDSDLLRMVNYVLEGRSKKRVNFENSSNARFSQIMSLITKMI